ncbi:Hypothetical protein NocV09_04500210 [Nannochloropsis oceanica]
MKGFDTEATSEVEGSGGKMVKAERIILVRHGESMGNVDEGGNQWYEMDDASCELIGFQKRHTKGSLWRLLRDIHEDVEGEGEEDEDGGDGPGEGGMSREGGGRMPASVEKERRERARERERLEREEEG